MRKIIYYQKENGKIPVKDFIEELLLKNKWLVSKIQTKITMLSLGITGNKDIKYVRDKIYELRIMDKNNISRVFYFSYEHQDIILLNGIVKKEQKLKNTDIERCIEYKKDYIKRFWNI